MTFAHRILNDGKAFDQDEKDALLALGTVMSVFSMLGSLSIIFSYWRFPALRKFSFELIVWLSVADVGNAFGLFFGNPITDEGGNTGTCKFQGFTIQFFSLASALWTTVIAHTLYQTIVKLRYNERQKYYYHGYAWGVSFLLAILPLTTNSYGPSGGWCWISSTEVSEFDEGTAWRYFSFYIPIWICIFANLYTYIIIIRTINRITAQASDESSEKLLRLIKRLRLYPLILVICWFIGTINRLQNTFDPKNPIFTLFMIQVFFQSQQGLLNAAAYGMNPAVQKAWRDEYPTVGRICTILYCSKDADRDPVNSDASDNAELTAPTGAAV